MYCTVYSKGEGDGPEAGNAAICLSEDGQPLDAARHLPDEKFARLAHDDQVGIVGDIGTRSACTSEQHNHSIINRSIDRY